MKKLRSLLISEGKDIDDALGGYRKRYSKGEVEGTAMEVKR